MLWSWSFIDFHISGIRLIVVMNVDDDDSDFHIDNDDSDSDDVYDNDSDDVDDDG